MGLIANFEARKQTNEATTFYSKFRPNDGIEIESVDTVLSFPSLRNHLELHEWMEENVYTSDGNSWLLDYEEVEVLAKAAFNFTDEWVVAGMVEKLLWLMEDGWQISYVFSR